MSLQLRRAFDRAKSENRNALVSFITAGYPTIESTVPILKGFQDGGVDVIELGIPFSDPIADGPTIQVANTKALENGVTCDTVLELVQKARAEGVTLPILLMGYYNPILNYGEEKFVKKCNELGVNGFIIVDLPPEDAVQFKTLCSKNALSLIPLIAPSTTDQRLKLFGDLLMLSYMLFPEWVLQVLTTVRVQTVMT